ncbi:molecular chaperone [Ecytonucleospora hepatopenaei]|uniref:Molecular chaperone n=1 Tax=Ecytonucleospora hepatopenaei TaxID=646526 RepID=A0A1W0E708_9MICR|nr:molecular chaperone [Ecytonucleospora hepatopenaei]
MSCMAGMVHGELQIIDNQDGERITPSVVCFPKDSKTGKTSIGNNAILAAQSNPENFVYEAKRMFGKGFYHKDIQQNMKYWPFKIKEIKGKGVADKDAEDNIGICVTVDGQEKIYEPIQISAAVLNYLAESARTRLNAFPTFIVITVPAYFHDGAKQRTLLASEIAFSNKKDENNNPLKVETVLLAEPTAAAMSYGSMVMKNKNEKLPADERILVFDLGGGTYDVSIVEFIYDPENPIGEVKATDGDNYLGGGDFDNIIIEMAKNEFIKQHGQAAFDNCDPLERKTNEIRLRQEAIKVKTQLSSNTSATFNLSCYRGTLGINFEVSRSRFERAARGLFERLEEKVKGVLLSYGKINPVYFDDGKLDIEGTRRANPGNNANFNDIIQNSKREINRVIMVGGSSRIPKVGETLMKMFGETADTPAAQKKVVAVLNPDESIAYGAGYYANACKPVEGDKGGHILLVDNTPLNLNIETLGGLATPLIHANTAIPAKATQIFSTAEDNQTAVTIRITQGNRSKSADNYLVGQFDLKGITPGRRGEAQIEVTFEVNENNILNVTAVDKKRNAKEVFVQNISNNLSDKDIENMINDAKNQEEADKLFRMRCEKKNQYEQTLFALDDAVAQSTAGEAAKADIKKIVDDELSWVGSEDFMKTEVEAIEARIKQKTDEIQKAIAAGGAQNQGQPQPDMNNNPTNGNNPDVQEL